MAIPIIVTVAKHPLTDKLVRNLEASMLRAGIESPLIKIVSEAPGSSAFNSPEFWSVIRQKTIHIYFALCEYDKAFFVDSDIVFLENPLPEIEALLEVYDIVGTNDTMSAYPFCAGAMAMTNRHKDIFHPEKARTMDCSTQGMAEQGLLNRALMEQPIKSYLLSPSQYANGWMWYRYNKSITPSMVHYNWLVHLDEKINKMKEFGHWYIED